MSWWWPFSWGRGNYTDAITAALEGMASAGPVPSPAATAAAEACAGIIARALAAATVRPAHRAITPAWLRRLGYDLVRAGEHLAVIEVNGGEVRLAPATTWTMHGGRPWRALVNTPTPDGSATRNIAEAGCVSILWAENELQPWRGRGPLSGASLTSGLLAAAHRSLGAEQAMPHTHLLPVPKSDQTETTKLENAIKTGAGKVSLTEATAGAWGQGASEAPKGRDYETRRIGADPPAASVELQDHAARQVIAACGLSPALLLGGTGAEAREDYRRFVATVVEPLGLIIAGELADKLDTDVALSFERLRAADRAGQARAAGSLVKAGWTPAEAATAVGLDPPAAKTEPSTGAVGSEPMADGSG